MTKEYSNLKLLELVKLNENAFARIRNSLYFIRINYPPRYKIFICINIFIYKMYFFCKLLIIQRSIFHFKQQQKKLKSKTCAKFEFMSGTNLDLNIC